MKINYQTKIKLTCQYCGHTAIPYIKMINFQISTEFSCTANCPRCGCYIGNLAKNDIIVKGK